MKDAMMEQVQLNTYVMIAPDIVVNNVSTVSYELCEYHNNVKMNYNLAVETPAELLVTGVRVITQRELFENIEEPWIQPEIGAWRRGNREYALGLGCDGLWCLILLKPSSRSTTARQALRVWPSTRREQFERAEYDEIKPEIVAWRSGSLEYAVGIGGDGLWYLESLKPLSRMTTAGQALRVWLVPRRDQFERSEYDEIKPKIVAWRRGSLEARRGSAAAPLRLRCGSVRRWREFGWYLDGSNSGASSTMRSSPRSRRGDVGFSSMPSAAAAMGCGAWEC